MASQVPEKIFLFNSTAAVRFTRSLPDRHWKKRKLRTRKLEVLHSSQLYAYVLALQTTSEVPPVSSEYATQSSADSLYRMHRRRVFLMNCSKKIRKSIFNMVQDNFSCPGMKQITLEKVKDALKYNQHRVEVSEDLQKASLSPLYKMLELTK